MSSDQSINVVINVENGEQAIKTLMQLKGVMTDAAEGSNVLQLALVALTNPLLAIPIAVAAVVGGFVAMADSAGKAALGLAKLKESATAMNISTDQLQAFQAAALQAGVSSETFNSAFERLTAGIIQARSGVGPLSTDLRRLFGDMEQAKDPVAVMEDLSKAMIKGQLNAKILRDAFGRGSWAEMANVLKDMGGDMKILTDNAAKMGLIIPADTITKAKELADQMKVIQKLSDVYKAETLMNLGAAAVQWEKIKTSIANIPITILDKLIGFYNGATGSTPNYSAMSSDQLRSKLESDIRILKDLQATQGEMLPGGDLQNNSIQIKQYTDEIGQLRLALDVLAMSAANVKPPVIEVKDPLIEMERILKTLTEDISNFTLADRIHAARLELAGLKEEAADLKLENLGVARRTAGTTPDGGFTSPGVSPIVALNSGSLGTNADTAVAQYISDFSKHIEIELPKSFEKVGNDLKHINFLSDWDDMLYQFSEAVSQHANDWKQDFNQVFGDMSKGITDFVTTGKFSFKDFTASILTDLAKIATEKALAGIFGSVLDAIGGPTFTPKSSDFYGSPLSGYASGGITNGFTSFGNQSMGESNAEAILPLTRDSNGNLGVSSSESNAGGINVGSVQVVVQSGSNDAVDQGNKAGQAFINTIKQIADQQITNALRPGNALFRGN